MLHFWFYCNIDDTKWHLNRFLVSELYSKGRFWVGYNFKVRTKSQASLFPCVFARMTFQSSFHWALFREHHGTCWWTVNTGSFVCFGHYLFFSIFFHEHHICLVAVWEINVIKCQWWTVPKYKYFITVLKCFSCICT